MSTESYLQGMNYETFVKRAHQAYNNRKPGMHLSTLQNLIWAEQGNSCVKHLPSFDKQLDQIKKYLVAAINKFISRKIDSEKKEALKLLAQRVEFASGSDEIIEIVNEGIELTQEYKNY